MNHDAAELLHKVENLKTYRRGSRRAPHKPLLLLIAISQLMQGHRRITFDEVETMLVPLLKAYAPPVVGRNQPELPYWHLANDGLWQVEDANRLSRQASGFPAMAALRKSSGCLPDKIADSLLADSGLVLDVVELLLEEHFPPSVHEDILSAVGLRLEEPKHGAERRIDSLGSRIRDPRFREAVLRAYDQRCAVTGFQAALGGSYFGCEAAHVQWHALDGPDIIANGIAMEPTIHKLFDAGAWSLTDDRRILVSADFTGSDAAIERVRSLHGRPLRSPSTGELVAPKFIRWHRESNLGGVFRQPALPL